MGVGQYKPQNSVLFDSIGVELTLAILQCVGSPEVRRQQLLSR